VSGEATPSVDHILGGAHGDDAVVREAQKLGQLQPSSFFGGVPRFSAGVRGPACIFWANLPPLSLVQAGPSVIDLADSEEDQDEARSCAGLLTPGVPRGGVPWDHFTP
jgi:hypothetical protein